jgi:hypothetical protein
MKGVAYATPFFVDAAKASQPRLGTVPQELSGNGGIQISASGEAASDVSSTDSFRRRQNGRVADARVRSPTGRRAR